MSAKVQKLMQDIDNIRNLSIIAHVDHGKTTLADSLLKKGGLISEEAMGTSCALDTTEEEKDRGITIKSTGVSLVFEHEDAQYLVNLVDSPGHVDFSSEVTAALRITDGALVVVDSVEGGGVQTETVLRQALEEYIRPVLHINKMDRLVRELKLDAEGIYQKLESILSNMNDLISSYIPEGGDPLTLDPLIGNVSFGSGKFGWAFTLPQVAASFAKKNGMSYEAVIKRMWGEHYYDPESKKFTTSHVSETTGKPLKRFVCQAVFDPFIKVFAALEDDATPETRAKALAHIGVTLSPSEQENKGSALLKLVLHRWQPAGDALCEMIVKHLPSPRVAQAYRASLLYTGPQDDEYAEAIRKCDPDGPLMMYISKMIVTPDQKRYICFGRIFSGTLKTGAKVRIIGANWSEEKPDEEVHVGKSVPRILMMKGKNVETIDFCTCGNTVGIMGIDKYLSKTGTITSGPNAFPIKAMKFSVHPIVRVAVMAKAPADLPKLLDGLQKLSNSDSCIIVSSSPHGEQIVAATGELHIEVALNTLRELIPNVAFTVSNPVVEFAETVTAKSSQVVMAKSPNNHNRIFMTAEPIPEDLCEAVASMKDPKERSQVLVSRFGWDKGETYKIWFFGPEKNPTCVFVDMTTGLQGLGDIKDSVRSAFMEVVSMYNGGVLSGEPMRNVRFNLMDAKIHQDSNHRGPGQIIPAAKRALLAAQFTAQPRLLEPFLAAEVMTPQECVSEVYNILSMRRGYVTSEEPKSGLEGFYIVKGFMPALESFGFNAALRAATSGKAFPHLVFDHWGLVDSDPFDTESFSSKLVKKVRERKEMPSTLPTLDKYHDKL